MARCPDRAGSERKAGMRVAQGTVARTRLWNLEQWRVRWKVTAAVAVPLAAAMLLGGLRLSVSFGDYSTYDDAADRISDIPVITALASAASTVAGFPFRVMWMDRFTTAPFRTAGTKTAPTPAGNHGHARRAARLWPSLPRRRSRSMSRIEKRGVWVADVEDDTCSGSVALRL